MAPYFTGRIESGNFLWPHIIIIYLLKWEGVGIDFIVKQIRSLIYLQTTFLNTLEEESISGSKF